MRRWRLAPSPVPQEVLKQRLVAGIYPNVFAAVKNIARTEGPRGFFVGALPTAARNVPFVVVTFTVYGALSAWRGEAKSTAESLGRGVTAALVAGVVRPAGRCRQNAHDDPGGV